MYIFFNSHNNPKAYIKIYVLEIKKPVFRGGELNTVTQLQVAQQGFKPRSLQFQSQCSVPHRRPELCMGLFLNSDQGRKQEWKRKAMQHVQREQVHEK